MRLCASMIARNEAGRYLDVVLDHLLGFCDEVAVLDDCSTDGTLQLLSDYERRHPGRVRVLQIGPAVGGGYFDVNEGAARQRLLEGTLETGYSHPSPTHVLAIDADELVDDGPGLRDLLERDHQGRAWSLTVREVWELDGDCLCLREDGGWRSHDAPLVWRVPEGRDWTLPEWRIPARQLASGRVPPAAHQGRRHTGVSLLHFGWANPATRERRHARYARIDGGRFHAGAHLDSILASPERVELRGVGWPTGLVPLRDRLRRAAGVACKP